MRASNFHEERALPIEAPTPYRGLIDTGTGRRDSILVLIIFLLNAVMIYAVFFPSLNQIGTWDESVYINEGRELAAGILPRLSHNPAVAALYAITYVPVQWSPYWLVYSCALGRFALFGLMWLSGFLVARRLTGTASPFIMVALIAISPALVLLVNNGSNAMFAAMSGFALWQMLSFERSGKLKHIWLTSLFVGLAGLSRNEGPVLFLTFVALTTVLCFRRGLLSRGLLAAVIPFVIVMGGYIGLYVARTGSFNLGVQERSYVTFEQGHGMAFAANYGTLQPYVEGQNDAVRLFGTAEENHYSILTAIRRNPPAYFQRIPRLAKSAIKDVFADYNWHFAFLCFAFAARGILSLLQKKSYRLLAVLLLWPSYTALYVLLCYQPTHLLMPFATLFALAAFGITATTANLGSRGERSLWTAGLVMLAAVGAAIYRQPNDLLFAPFLLLAALWLMWIVTDQAGSEAAVKDDSRDQPRENKARFVRDRVSLACLVLLAVTVLVRFGVVHAVPRAPLGSAPDEQATVYLRQHFPSRSAIGAYGPGKIWAADMVHVQMVNFHAMTSAQALWDWMGSQGVQAIYVDNQLRAFEPVAWDTIQKQIGRGLEVGFNGVGPVSADDTVQVLVRTGLVRAGGPAVDGTAGRATTNAIPR